MTRLLTLLIARCSRKTNSVRGSSIVETVISLTILLTILTLSFTRIDRINRSINPQLLYKAHLVTNEVILKEDLFIADIDEYEVDGLLVRKIIKDTGDDLFELELKVFSVSGKLIYTRKKMIVHGMEL